CVDSSGYGWYFDVW
nr:immunoglobulin heavy chain junction region [Mus musculus]MBK4189886.1 immunoglobulin heavy chain junction region [Mus musculus]